MAVNVDLGTVTFALVANTKQLKETLNDLNKVSARVNKFIADTGEGADAQARHWHKVETQLGRVFQSVTDVTARLQKSGAGAVEIDKLSDAYRELARQMGNLKTGEKLDFAQFSRAKINTDALIAQAKGVATEAERTQRTIRSQEALTEKMMRQAAIEDTMRRQKASAEAIAIAQKRDEQLFRMNTTQRNTERKAEEQWLKYRQGLRNKAAMQQAKDQEKAFRELANVERNIGLETIRVNNLNRGASRLGVAAPYIAANTANLGNLNAAIARKDSSNIIASQLALKESMARTRGEMTLLTHSTSRISGVFKELSRGSILMLGPLSGVGARMAVISALFEGANLKMALFVGGMAATLFTIAKLGSAGIKAAIDMEKFDAQLTASSGSSVLARVSYREAAAAAEKFGLNLRGLIEPFAKFEASARLSGLSAKAQKDVFEGITTASTAMRLDSQRTGLVFMAFEQMLNKGTVSMEELRRQLGDLIPGAFELAASAAGKSTQEFAKMIAKGEVLSKDLVPALAKTFKDQFGPAALKAAESIQGQLNRLATETFELAKAFDSATGFSEGFRIVLLELRSVVHGLTGSMDGLNRVIVTLGGALAGLALPAFLRSIPVLGAAAVKILGDLGAAISLLRAGAPIAGVLAAAGITIGGATVGWLVALAAAVVGAVVAYKAYGETVKDIILPYTEFLGLVNKDIDNQNKLKGVQERVWKGQMQETQLKVAGLLTEIAATEFLIEAEERRANAVRKHAEDAAKNTPYGAFRPGLTGQKGTLPSSETPELQRLLKSRADLQKAFDGFQAVFARLAAQKVIPETSGDTGPGDAFLSWLANIKKQLRDVKTIEAEVAEFVIGGGSISLEAIKARDEAWNKAIDTFLSMPKKQQGSFKELSKMLEQFNVDTSKSAEEWAALPDAMKESLGKVSPEVIKFITGLAKMAEAGSLGANKFKELAKGVEQAKSAAEKAGKLREDLDLKMKAANEETMPEHVRSTMAIAKATAEYAKNLETSNTVTGDAKNILVAKFQADQENLRATLDQSKAVVQLEADLKSLYNTVGDKGDRVAQKMLNQLEVVERAASAPAGSRGAITAQEAADLRLKIMNQGYLEMIATTTVFGRNLKELMNQLEDGLAKGWVDMLLDGTASFKEMFKQIERDMLTWLIKMQIVAPAMKALFGGLFTGKEGDVGTGLLEKGITSLIPGLSGLGGNTSLFGAGLEPVAKGGVFNSPGISGLSGGVYNSPTFFRFSRGGVLGEAGPEAVLPLTRNAQGKLGVSAQGGGGNMNFVVNILNQTGQPVAAEQQGQPQFDGEKYVIGVVLNALEHNPRIRRSMAGALR